MPTLSTLEIRKYLRETAGDRLVITPLLEPEEQTKNNTVDLRLGNEFIITQRTSFRAIDPTNERKIEERIGQYQQKVRLGLRERFVLHPGHLILGCSLEYISLPSRLSAYVIGRSSWGRLGLVIATATFVSPCFKGSLTLELVNLGETPLVLYPGARIAQLVLHTVLGEAGYEGRYNCPTGPQFSRIHRDKEMSFWGRQDDSISRTGLEVSSSDPEVD